MTGCGIVLVAVFLLVAVARDVLEHEREVGVGFVVEFGVRVHVDGARIGNAADEQVEVERGVIAVVGLDAHIPNARLDLVVCGCAVGIDGFALSTRCGG